MKLDNSGNKGAGHTHDWIIQADDMRWRDPYGKEYILDLYICKCRANGMVKTPKEQYDKGLKTLGIKELFTEKLL